MVLGTVAGLGLRWLIDRSELPKKHLGWAGSRPMSRWPGGAKAAMNKFTDWTDWFGDRQAAVVTRDAHENATPSLGAGCAQGQDRRLFATIIGQADAVIIVPMAWLTVGAIVHGRSLSQPRPRSRASEPRCGRPDDKVLGPVCRISGEMFSADRPLQGLAWPVLKTFSRAGWPLMFSSAWSSSRLQGRDRRRVAAALADRPARAQLHGDHHPHRPGHQGCLHDPSWCPSWPKPRSTGILRPTPQEATEVEAEPCSGDLTARHTGVGAEPQEVGVTGTMMTTGISHQRRTFAGTASPARITSATVSHWAVRGPSPGSGVDGPVPKKSPSGPSPCGLRHGLALTSWVWCSPSRRGSDASVSPTLELAPAQDLVRVGGQ